MNIIKYGGSKVRPNEDTYDDDFIQGLIGLVKKHSDQEFMIIVGGGALARKKQNDNPNVDQEKKDWLGIEATWENAEYVVKKFKEANLHCWWLETGKQYRLCYNDVSKNFCSRKSD